VLCVERHHTLRARYKVVSDALSILKVRRETSSNSNCQNKPTNKWKHPLHKGACSCCFEIDQRQVHFDTAAQELHLLLSAPKAPKHPKSEPQRDLHTLQVIWQSALLEQCTESALNSKRVNQPDCDQIQTSVQQIYAYRE
jgi:hypothetical protein